MRNFDSGKFYLVGRSRLTSLGIYLVEVLVTTVFFCVSVTVFQEQ